MRDSLAILSISCIVRAKRDKSPRAGKEKALTSQKTKRAPQWDSFSFFAESEGFVSDIVNIAYRSSEAR